MQVILPPATRVPFAARRRTVCGVTPTVESPAALAELLDQQGYLPDEGIATAAYLAIVMNRPLFCEGDAGVGKTALAHALAGAAERPADPAAVL